MLRNQDFLGHAGATQYRAIFHTIPYTSAYHTTDRECKEARSPELRAPQSRVEYMAKAFGDRCFYSMWVSPAPPMS